MKPNADSNVQKTQRDKTKITLSIVAGLCFLLMIGCGALWLCEKNRANKLTEGNNTSTGQEDNDGSSSEDDPGYTFTFKYHGHNTLDGTRVSSEVVEQAIELQPEDKASQKSIKIADSTDDPYTLKTVELTFSIEDGRIKISNDSGDEYTIQKIDDADSIIELNREYITILNKDGNIYQSVVDRPDKYMTDINVNGVPYGASFCPVGNYSDDLSQFEDSFYGPFGWRVKKVPYEQSYGFYYIYEGGDGWATFRPSC